MRDYDAAGQPMQANSWSGNTEFLVPNSFDPMTFYAGAAGRISRLEMRPRAGIAETAMLTQKAPPSRVEVPVNVGVLEEYVGTDELAPNFQHTFHWARIGRSTKMGSSSGELDPCPTFMQ